MLVLMAGLPGTGKTTVAFQLAAKTSGTVLNKDEFRHALFTAQDIEYSTRQDDFCLELMLETATYLLSSDRSRTIFLDGRTFSRRYQIENVLSVAKSLHHSWKILECVCSEETALRRLDADATAGTHPAGNRGAHLYRDVKARFESINFPKIVIDTDQPLDICVDVAHAALSQL